MQFPRYQLFTPSPVIRKASIAEDKNYVGLDQLQDQTKLRALRKGFVFNLMVVGRSGLGKSTLVDTLFKSSVSHKTENKEEGEGAIPPTSQIRSKTSVLNEKGVKLTLTVTDTPGFGDHVNNENCWDPAVQYINDQYASYLEQELKVNRPAIIPDSRVHCCLYFIQPSGHALTCLDIEVLKRLCKIVNVIPLIAKADTLTIEERSAFKERIRADLADHDIIVYPNKEYEDGEDAPENEKIRDTLPFAVIGSTIFHDIHGRKVLGRKSKWGIVDIENKNHSDFPALRDIIIRTHMTDLVEVTSTHHFETFRKNKISGNKSGENQKDQHTNTSL